MSDPAYIIGIDLGTTNTVVSYTAAQSAPGSAPEIKIFKIPQLVAAGVVEKRTILPSFVLLPGSHDVAAGALALPWDSRSRIAVGEYARDRGAEIPHRLVASAKSWLCHDMVDRNAAILPWGSTDNGAKLSPVEASAEILSHIRKAWNHEIAGSDAALRLENQEVLLTVPASFDAVARELTVQAAAKAGMPGIILLEEPQAAFYAWIESQGDGWRRLVSRGDRVLVCDVGGGTSDFSLIRVEAEQGELVLERIAVGNHLLVGGDNMDLALAYAVARRLDAGGQKLDQWQMRGLWHSCRSAKEKLLAAGGNESFPVTVLGRGSRLIGGTLTSELDTRDVIESVLEGFFPPGSIAEKPADTRKSGIRELGLRYASDPAITRHLGHFCRQHGAAENENDFPTAILFNGGVMKAPLIRRRVKEIIGSWQTVPDRGAIREIESKTFDLAVARGAAYYGLSRKGRGIRIKSGLNRSYYIGISASLPAVPGLPAPMKSLCVANFGMEEGTDALLQDQTFALVVGEPVQFDFMGSAVRLRDAIGTVVEQAGPGEIDPITTLETVLDGRPGTVIPVMLEVKATEVGTLEVWCIAKNGDNRWKLEFNVREKE